LFILEADIEKALRGYHDESEHGWSLMFSGLKEMLETENISDKM
jgi:hypothetical protein